MKPQLVDILEFVKERIPQDASGKGFLRYSINEAAVCSNLEIIYGLATSRLSHLAYFIDSSATVSNMKDFKPCTKELDLTEFRNDFHDYDAMSLESARRLNQQMHAWVCNVVMRELCEYLHYHLLQVYEACMTIKLAGQDITPDQIDGIRRDSGLFEGKTVSERLNILKKDFGIVSVFQQELASLYKARHVFAHFDGYIQKKFCDENGFFTLFWPKNKCRLVKRSNGKKVPYHKVPRPIDSNVFTTFEITYFGQPVRMKYKIGDRINIDSNDVRDLIFLFNHVFDQLQGGLVKFVQGRNLKVRDFESYRLKAEIMAHIMP